MALAGVFFVTLGAPRCLWYVSRLAQQPELASVSDLRTLAEQAQRGDVAAYGQIVALTERQILAGVVSILRDRDAALDVVQEAYLAGHKKLATLGDPALVLPWLERIATNTALNQLRARRSLSRLSDAALVQTQPSVDEETFAALERALVVLSDEERRLCERFYRGGWSVARLAKDAGRSEVAVRKRLERLRTRLKEIVQMELRKERISSELSQKIVRLLAHPSLTDLPENPVGAVWSALLPSLAGFEEVELPETVALADVAEVVGEARMKEIQYRQHHLDAGRVLRSDTSMPMLIDTARSPRPCRRIAKGKVYRDETEDHRHLQAFHQAEILVVEPDADEWAMAAWLSDRARELFGDRKLMMKQIDFHFMCQRAFELHVEVDGEWLEVAGFGRFFDDIAERLGGPGARAVGAGLGLERWAQLAYGIDDIRKVENARVPEG